MRLLRRGADDGRGVLAVLHDLNLAAAYADRVVLMATSRVVAAGPPADVLRPDLLEQVFGIPMLVLPHPHRRHPLVIAEPPLAGATADVPRPRSPLFQGEDATLAERVDQLFDDFGE
jgi:iron complex transport system ATP-binding protein